jgi:hypothetical protein
LVFTGSFTTMTEHEDHLDRQLLTNVPREPVTPEQRLQVHRFYQWLHMLRNFGEISRVEPDKKYARVQKISRGGMPDTRFVEQ